MEKFAHLQDSGFDEIFSTTITILRLQGFSAVFSKHMTHLGSMFWKYFLAKLPIFFAPLCLNLCIFNTAVVIKYIPHWSQSPCLWGFLSHGLVYLGSWFWNHSLIKHLFFVTLTSPHYDRSYESSGQSLKKNSFHMFHNFCVSKHVTFVPPLWQNLCIFRTVDLIKYFPHLSQSCICSAFLLCEETCDSSGKYVLEIFSRKTLNFLCRSGFAPLCLSLCIFNMVAVTKYFPQWSQGPCLWGFLSHELVYRITHLGSWFWYNLQGSGYDEIFSTPITILHF